MEEPDTKRFKPAATKTFIDLSSDSDDDIQITAVNNIPASSTTVNNHSSNSDKIDINLNKSMNIIQPPPSKEGQLFKAQEQEQQLQTATASAASAATNVSLDKEGIMFNIEQGILLDNVIFNSISDVERRLSSLQADFTLLKSQVDEHNFQKSKLDDNIITILKKKKNIEDIGFTARSSTQIRQYNEEIHNIVTKRKQIDEEIERFEALVRKSENRLAKFISNDKLKIITLLDIGNYQARSIYLKYLREIQTAPPDLAQAMRNQINSMDAIARKKAQMRSMQGTFNGMASGLGNIRNDDNDENQENSFGGMNIYNSADTQDLRALLQSVKRIEKSKDDESNTPDDLTINLLRHQKQGLKWMEEIEDDPKKCGGILADDMGLGKTVQAISLMLSHRIDNKTNNSLTRGAAATVALNAMKKAQEYDDDDSDFEIISENSGKKKFVDESEEEEMYKLSESEEEKTVERKEESDDQMEKKKIIKTNLIVCPVALMEQWRSEIETKVKESANFNVMIFNSLKGKKITFKQLSRYDVVLVSYQTLSSELKKHLKSTLGTSKITEVPQLQRINQKKLNSRNRNEYFSPFYEPEASFRRIILDEAQMIKNRLTTTSIACASIEGNFRWCLSGTPMQNNIDELFPLIRFLRIKPYCNYSRFATQIGRPMSTKSHSRYDDQDKERAFNMVRVLLKAILFRREKTSMIDGKPILTLPKKEIIKHKIDMSINSNEKSFYISLEANSAKTVEQIINGPKAKGNYSSILTLLLRLRQACIHSELVRIGERKHGITYDEDGNSYHVRTIDAMFEYAKSFKDEVIKRINNAEEASEENRFLCPICFDYPTDENWMLATPCGHGMCVECVDKFFEQFQDGQNQPGFRKSKCTTCRLEIKEDKFLSFDIFDRCINKKQNLETIKIIYAKTKKEFDNNKSLTKKNLELSPKFKKAMELIEEILKNSKDEKIILFSEFTSMFELFINFLKKSKIKSLLYIGSMNSQDRNETVKTFYRDPEQRILLISLKAGNVGLTLTCANHVILMDPFWNPYVEEQAQDRAYRIGQNKIVKVHRLLNSNTVEDRIIELQEKKKQIIESAMGSEGLKKASALGTREIGFLFGLNDLD